MAVCVGVVSAPRRVDGFGKVKEQSEHNVLTFRTERQGKIIIIKLLMTKMTKKAQFSMS